MQIASLQKVSLIDYPEKIACTIFLYGCNFRCGFCHNPELVVRENKENISEREILDYLEKRNMIIDGHKGILWIYNPSKKLEKAIQEGVEV